MRPPARSIAPASRSSSAFRCPGSMVQWCSLRAAVARTGGLARAQLAGQRAASGDHPPGAWTPGPAAGPPARVYPGATRSPGQYCARPDCRNPRHKGPPPSASNDGVPTGWFCGNVRGCWPGTSSARLFDRPRRGRPERRVLGRLAIRSPLPPARRRALLAASLRAAPMQASGISGGGAAWDVLASGPLLGDRTIRFGQGPVEVRMAGWRGWVMLRRSLLSARRGRRPWRVRRRGGGAGWARIAGGRWRARRAGRRSGW